MMEGDSAMIASKLQPRYIHFIHFGTVFLIGNTSECGKSISYKFPINVNSIYYY